MPGHGDIDVGRNRLGRLWMELRDELAVHGWETRLLVAVPPAGAKLMGRDLTEIAG